ncbi:MAG: amidohydrolase family protein [Nitrospinota bacterium]
MPQKPDRPRVVDFHTHMAWMDGCCPGYLAFMNSMVAEPFEDFMERYKTPEPFLRVMDENSVGLAVVLAEYSPATTGIASHEQLLDYCSASSRLIPFANINPYLTHRPARLLEDLLKRGVRGLKLCPTYQYFYPNDRMLYPLYAVAQEAGVPVLVHTGTSMFPGSRLKYGDPLFLDSVAVDFPDLHLGITHGGRGFWYQTAFSLLRLHENLFIDLAGLPPQKLLTYYPEMERLSNQFVFGSDWPGLPRTIALNVAAVEALGISPEARKRILAENALQLLRYDDGAGS